MIIDFDAVDDGAQIGLACLDIAAVEFCAHQIGKVAVGTSSMPLADGDEFLAKFAVSPPPTKNAERIQNELCLWFAERKQDCWLNAEIEPEAADVFASRGG